MHTPSPPPPPTLPIPPTTDTTLATHLRTLPAPPTPATLILGNESADLDSIASTLSLSLLSPTPTTPILNLRRPALSLRPDVTLALTLANIPPSLPPCLDDAITPTLLAAPPVGVTLVDHNTPSSRQIFLAPRVTSIIDHHTDERKHLSASPRTIAPVASCATLIFEHAQSQSTTSETAIPPSCAILLLCAILLDTHNMHPAVGKGTPRDAAAISHLTNAASITPHQRDSLFNALLTARTDTSSLTAYDLLHKDVKYVKTSSTTIAIPSITISPEDLIQRANNTLSETFARFAAENGVDAVVAILGFPTQDSGYTRQLLLSDNDVGNTIASFLQSSSDADVLNIQPGPSLSGLRRLHQRNSKASRKVVLPIINNFLQSENLRR